MDGANVEIHEAVGDDNIIIFGMSTPEVNELKRVGYNPMNYYQNNADIRKVVDFINGGINGKVFPITIRIWFLPILRTTRRLRLKQKSSSPTERRGTECRL